MNARPRTLTKDQYDSAVSLWTATGLTRPWNDPMDDLLRAMNGATSTVLGYSLDGDLVATAMVGHDGHRGWVYYLAVAPDRQESGLGRMMMEACEHWLVERGAVKVQLMIRTNNSPVIGFYDQLGYELSDVQVRAKWLNADHPANTDSAAH
ncbi:GNAT family acetyltransferase [Arthrobacter sp. zg-ZUI100]|uniref:GNAT family acetyltransferase n=1 Tax=Arthrobacter jiangjiafuii TaxID=2817475 RepID=UPI001AEE5560|nr:GNAT family acetyltransferase [Arthrobacter jiangjiafuii]MBP3036631.1 GNAT family acetyltransferase [Arthrobacter jiangjiafuii]